MHRPTQMGPTSSYGPPVRDTVPLASSAAPAAASIKPSSSKSRALPVCRSTTTRRTSPSLRSLVLSARRRPERSVRVPELPPIPGASFFGGEAAFPPPQGRAMQSAAAIGLVRPCAAARPLAACPSARRGAGGCGGSLLPVLKPPCGLRLTARAGLVPASPLEEEEGRRCRAARDVAASAAAGKAAGEEAGGGGLMKTLQLGALFGLWYLLNIYFNIYNKQVLKALPYPINITELQFAVGTVIAVFMWITGILKRPKISGAQLLAVLPLAIVHTMGNLFTNMSLGKVAVSFTHTIKAMEPFFSVLLSAIFLGEMPTTFVVLSLLPIVGGVALASLTEASFNWAGFWSAMASNVTFQSRNVLSKKLMVKKDNEESLDNINLFSIITVMSFFLLAPVTLFTEGVKFSPAFLQSAGLNLQQIYTRALIAAFCFHAYQQASYMILARVSPVTHSVGNCVKRVVVIVTSVLFFRTPVSPINSLGTGIALAGVFLYSQLKRLKPKPKAA